MDKEGIRTDWSKNKAIKEIDFDAQSLKHEI